MVVGGLPKPCDNHAEKVAHMACSMMEASQKVLSPVDKTPLKVLTNAQNPLDYYLKYLLNLFTFG